MQILKSISIIIKLKKQYNPELVIISSGYDAAIGCFEVNEIFFNSFLFLFQIKYEPELIIVSCGFDSAIGDEKVRNWVFLVGLERAHFEKQNLTIFFSR